MEVIGPHNTPTCLDINSSGGSSRALDHLTQCGSKDLSMIDLKTCLTELIDVEDTKSSPNQLNLSPVEDYVDSVVKACECPGLKNNAKGNSASEKCLSKCADFQPARGPKSSLDSLTCDKEMQEEGLSAEVFEVPLKLVSAMKGSREKKGIPPKSLSVTWAPDVYDPVPTSVSHIPANKNQSYRSNSKKSGKYKQKASSKSSRSSSKGKDKIKKQVRRSSGGSTKLKPFYDDWGTSSAEAARIETVDFDIGTPDPFCGSSFLTESVANLHFSVAEAT